MSYTILDNVGHGLKIPCKHSNNEWNPFKRSKGKPAFSC